MAVVAAGSSPAHADVDHDLAGPGPGTPAVKLVRMVAPATTSTLLATTTTLAAASTTTGAPATSDPPATTTTSATPETTVAPSTTAAPTTAPPTTEVPPPTDPATAAAPSAASSTAPPPTAPPTTAPPTTAPAPQPPPAPAAPQPASAPDPHDPGTLRVWLDLARCESGGNWSINTGNGYYGGLQFSLPTWRSVGGTGYPHEHSRETQIEMGRRLQARSGWGSWPHCSAELGLR